MAKKINNKKDRRKSEAFLFAVFFICSLLSMVLGVFCIREMQNVFIKTYGTFVIIGYCLLICATFTISVWMLLTRKIAFIKTWISVYIFLLFALGMWFLLQKTGFFEVIRSPERLQDYLASAGIWMPTLYILLQFLQVVILPIPSVVSTVAGVALFGAFRTTLYSLTGILLGSIAAFFIGRKLGAKAVSWIVGEDNLIKWQKKLKGKDNLFLTLMFILPLFPDDILCFLAGLSTLSTRYFLMMISISRVLAITATCYSIDFIPFTTWWGIALWLAFFIGVVAVFILLYKNLDKVQRFHKKIQEKRKQKAQKK